MEFNLLPYLTQRDKYEKHYTSQFLWKLDLQL